MGSLFESPKIPEAQPAPRRIVYTTLPAPVESSQPVQSDEEIQGQARTQSLLRRNRGRLGTIVTSFSGFLQPSETGARRKTLLGE